MGIRSTLVASATVLALLPLAGCSADDDDPVETPAQPAPTTDADCARRLPDEVFTTLGWTPTAKGAEATVRGCHRDAEQGYVEVRDRAGYDQLCATLDRTGSVGPGTPVDWLGADVTACAVEPTTDVGTTKVVVRHSDGAATQVSVAALSPTKQPLVRRAVEQLL